VVVLVAVYLLPTERMLWASVTMVVALVSIGMVLFAWQARKLYFARLRRDLYMEKPGSLMQRNELAQILSGYRFEFRPDERT
jgi:hypothetical protein